MFSSFEESNNGIYLIFESVWIYTLNTDQETETVFSRKLCQFSSQCLYPGTMLKIKYQVII